MSSLCPRFRKVKLEGVAVVEFLLKQTAVFQAETENKGGSFVKYIWREVFLKKS